MTAAPSLPEIKIDAHASADDARAFLERDRLMAAYALADIDQPEIEGARWWIARRDGEIAAVVMVVAAISPDHAWKQPLLRLVDTIIGVAVGVAGAWIGLKSGHHRSTAA